MLFHSTIFLACFLVFFPLYWLSRGQVRRWLLLAASLGFYAAWDYRFCVLLVALAAVNHLWAQATHRTANFRTLGDHWQRLIFALLILINLAPLLLLKYADFIADTLNHLIGLFSDDLAVGSLSAINPVGISFFTFQGLSYVIDVRRRQTGMLAVGSVHYIDVLQYLAFFPQLIAGPIERSRTLMPQILTEREFDSGQFRQGVWLFAVGLALKIGIADTAAHQVDAVFNSLETQSLLSVYAGTLAFSIQILCDFAGYSSMAQGLGKMLGFELSTNFARPYFSTSFAEFWRRWHITLGSWFRDYVYIPLGGSRAGRQRTLFNLVGTMALCGLWHGASWAFVAWGVLHGLFLAVERVALSPPSSGVPRVLYGVVVFHGVLVGWFLFRVGDLGSAIGQAAHLVSASAPGGLALDWATIFPFAAFLGFVLLHDIPAERANSALFIGGLAAPRRALIYAYIAFLILSSGGGFNEPFIYFQF